jgi:hypothetical protein
MFTVETAKPNHCASGQTPLVDGVYLRRIVYRVLGWQLGTTKRGKLCFMAQAAWQGRQPWFGGGFF